MSLTFKLKEKEFGVRLAELVKITGRSAGEVVRSEARLLVQDVAKLTPPFSKAPNSESYGVQRKTGEAAVERDIKKLFGVVPDPSKIKNRKIRKDLERAIRKRDFESIKNILRYTKLGENASTVTLDADPAVHARERDRRGRITKRITRFFIIRESSRKRLIRLKQKSVGKAKSGWVKAGKALKAVMPAWITRHAGSPGEFIDKTKDTHKPMVRIVNAVPYIQAQGAELRIVQRAMNNRVRNLKVRIERILKSKWKRK